MGRLDQLLAGTTRLSRQDAGFLERESSATPMHAAVVALMSPRPDGTPVTVAAVRDEMAHRLQRMPHLHHRLLEAPGRLGRPRWAQVGELDLARHVTGWPVDDDGRPLGFDDGIARLAEARLDRDRPLWQVRVGGPIDEDGRFPIAFVFHHAMADGGLARQLVADLFTPDLDAGDPVPAPPRRPSHWRLTAVALAEEGRGRLGGARRARRRPGPAAGPPVAAPSRTSSALLAGPVGPGRRIGTFVVSMQDLRAVRAARGGTVNDVFVAAVTHGIRRLRIGRGIPDGDREVVALIPRDVRRDAEKDTIGNRTATMFLTLPVDVGDPEERFAAVRAATERAKGSAGSAGTGQFRFDVTISNVRFDPGPGSRAGAEVRRLYATAPLQGHNRLVVLGLSYGDQFTVTATADADAVPDLHVLVEGMRAGFADLFDLAAARQRP